jgi:hypothetical protein
MAANNTLRAAAALFLLALPLHASVAPAIPFEDKVRNADAIVLGRCVATESAWDPTGRWILTRSTFQVEKALKGAAVPAVTVVTPGGQVGTLRQETVGVPRFERGSENVLFVKNSSVGPTVLYMEQGAYQVEERDGQKTVQPAAAGLVLVDNQTGRAIGGESVRSFREFEGEVRRVLERDRERPQRYDVAAPKQPQKKTPGAELGDLAKRYRFVIALAVLAIALSTYLIIKGR